MPTVIDKTEETLDTNSYFRVGMFPISLKIETKGWTDDEYFEFCQIHEDLIIETDKNSSLLINRLRGAEQSSRNAEICMRLASWAKKDDTGKTFLNTGFKLPSGANFASGVSWILKDKYNSLTKKQREKFPPIAPDFAIELRSSSDRLKPLQEKMEEYIENGVRLGWLIDPYQRQVHIYRKNGEIEILENPKIISGEDVLEGFELDLKEIL